MNSQSTKLQTSSVVAIDQQRFRRGEMSSARRDQFIASRLALIEQLQVTLDPAEQLGIFRQELNQLVAVHSLAFHTPGEEFSHRIGRISQHSCSYRLITAEENLGELSLTRREPFSENELEQIEQLITTLVFPLRNALRYRNAMQSALIDILTGAGNRLALTQALSREYQCAQRYGHSLSVLMLDLDHFKQVNDRHGHAAGDHVLSSVARLISGSIRSTDTLFRYGGEEFLLLLPETANDGAQTIAERLRQKVEELIVCEDGLGLRTTISIGIATLNASDKEESLIKRADNALYDAKHSGRNLVCGAVQSTRCED